MKTSNKLFVAAVALVLGSLATYNVALRAEYRTGHHGGITAQRTGSQRKATVKAETIGAVLFAVAIATAPQLHVAGLHRGAALELL